VALGLRILLLLVGILRLVRARCNEDCSALIIPFFFTSDSCGTWRHLVMILVLSSVMLGVTRVYRPDIVYQRCWILRLIGTPCLLYDPL
jgi:hypothetical protein